MKKVKQEYPRTNDIGVNIEDRIKDGLTLVFDSMFKALEVARNTGSYVYWVYENGETNGQYAVPK